MPNIATIGRFNPLNLFRSQANRRPFYSRIAVAPASRHRAQSTRPNNEVNKPLASRSAKVKFAPQSNKIDGANGTTDANEVVHIIKQGKVNNILEAARLTATDIALESKETRSEYKGDFFTQFHEDISQMSDKNLGKMHSNLNNKKMLALRSGLKFAAHEGLGTAVAKENGVRRELGTTSHHLEATNRLLVAEMSQRGMKLSETAFEQVPDLTSWQGNKSTKKTLLNFSTSIALQISSQSGNVPEKILSEMQSDFTQLCAESETALTPGKEAGVTRLNRNDPSSPELNTSDLYTVDFHRGVRTFSSSDGMETNRQTGLRPENRQEISDHLTNFCKGGAREALKHSPEKRAELSANQARRVQVLLTQQTLAPIEVVQTEGKFDLGLNVEDKNKNGQQFIGPKKYHFDVERAFNGDVDVYIRLQVKPKLLVFKNSQGHLNIDNGLKIDSKKSYVQSNLRITVPRRKSAAPIIRSFDYAAHIVKKDDWG